MLLLDTHVFLWFENRDNKLSAPLLEFIETTMDVYVSIATFWELAIKNSLGKLALKASITDIMQDCVEYNFTILPIRAAHLEILNGLPWIHRDPFDRLLVSQAKAENLTLVTADNNIRKYDVTTLWK